MADNKKILEVHKSREILLNILTRQGYLTEDYIGFSISEIHALVANNQLDLLLNKSEDGNGKKVYIKYFLDKTIRPVHIHDIIDDLFNIEEILSKNDDLIIIVKDEPNEQLQKLQTSIYTHDGILVTLININRLQFNILDHCLVPKHKLLSEEESIAIKAKYNIMNDSNLPEISRFDPVSQVMSIRPGEIFEIERPSKTSIINKYYRICS